MEYTSKLHPRCDYLWQQPREPKHLKDADFWFKPLKIGQNPLSTFMSRISHSVDLSRVYTNHSIRVTGTTMLGRFNFSNKQIMSVSGHRSTNSLSVYKKLSDEEKIMMGIAMNHYLQSDVPHMHSINKSVKEIAPKPIPAALRAEPTFNEQAKTDKNNREIVQFEPENPLLQEDFAQNLDFDVRAILNDIEQNVAISQIDTLNTRSTTLQCQTKKKSSPSIPIFNICRISTIGNIHHHIHKN